MVSAGLWPGDARGLSAEGRVAVRCSAMIVDREREIRAFIPEKFWKFIALLEYRRSGPVRCAFRWPSRTVKSFRPLSTRRRRIKALALLKRCGLQLTKASKNKPTVSKPNAPFITSTLANRPASYSPGLRP